MTKKLSELFELPEPEQEVNELNIEKAEADIVTQEAYTNLEKIENALPQVRGLEASDTEMDELAELAKSSYKDLMDLGMNVESRYSGRVFEVAGTMLKNAIDAKAAKIDKKLKMIELQIKKEKLDKENNSESLDVSGTGVIVSDRNSLIEKLKNMK